MFDTKQQIRLGVLLLVISASLEILLSLTQTEPSLSLLQQNLSDLPLVLLLMLSSIFLANGYALTHDLDAERTLNVLPALLLVVGIVGLILTMMFHNLLVDIFFPRTLVTGFLLLDSLILAATGFFIFEFARGKNRSH
ncbi:MAG: hypothetical protein K9W43_03845 [Candidatus Thorarchaeota archaeon]|nr:hypothetical protein [Candidatus Thorarchaeota archaeon]